jgi:hypothetical protein
MTFSDVKDVVVSIAAIATAVGTAWNVWNIRRVEKNTNSISIRNEAIAKQLGVVEGKAEEKANPT